MQIETQSKRITAFKEGKVGGHHAGGSGGNGDIDDAAEDRGRSLVLGGRRVGSDSGPEQGHPASSWVFWGGGHQGPDGFLPDSIQVSPGRKKQILGVVVPAWGAGGAREG